MSDAVLISIISLIGTIFTSCLTFIINRKANTIHTLVNSTYGASLKVGYLALKRIANSPDACDKDKQAAFEAKKLLDDHIAKQAVEDAK